MSKAVNSCVRERMSLTIRVYGLAMSEECDS